MIMKILFITNIPVPYRVNFYNELGKYADVTVVFEAKSASDQGIKFNWNLESIKNFKAIFLSDGDIKEKQIDWKIFKYLNAKEYDAIILTSYAYLTEMAFLIGLKLTRKKYYLSSDGGLIKYNESIFMRFLKKYLIHGAEGYFSPSAQTDDYLCFYGAEKNRLIRYPFTSLWKKDIIERPIQISEKIKLRKKYNVPYNKMIIGVGQFIPRKGWDILLRAIKCSDLENVGLYIIGGIPTSEYNKIVEEQKLHNVHFLNFMGNEELAEYYLMADIFCLPTREDIWGLVINEAMAKGLPVITTDKCIAGLELVKGNGAIIPVDNVENLRSAIISALKNTCEYSEQSIKVISDYTIENMVRAYLKGVKNEW